MVIAAGTVGAFFLDVGSALGLSWPTVFWASLGGYFGLVSAPPEGRCRANFTYAGSVFASAHMGSVVAELLFSSNPRYANALALGFGWSFHLLLALGLGLLREALGRVPEFFQAILARVRGTATKSLTGEDKK